MVKMIVQAVLMLAVGYMLIVAIIYFIQGSLLYFPSKTIEQTPAGINLAYEDVRLTTSDGVAIAAWYVEAAPERGVLLFCHGNAGNISHRLDSIKIFNSLGLSVLIFDYRGYGQSQGSPSEQGTYEDAAAAWQYLVTVRQKDPQKIILFGRSLGAAVAAETACRNSPAGLIMESCFTSVPDLGQKLYPWLPVRLLARLQYAAAARVGAAACPVLIIHSPDDEIVPYEHGRRLYAQARQPKEFLAIRGSHNQGFLLSGPVYIEGLNRFLIMCLSGVRE
jgi:hypothetical protein